MTADKLAGVGQTDDKTLIVVIDDFSSRVRHIQILRSMIVGIRTLPTYYDNLVDYLGHPQDMEILIVVLICPRFL